MKNIEQIKYQSEDIDLLVKEKQPLMNIMENDFASGVAIYGAGAVGSWAVTYLQSIGAKVICFIDRDSAKQGTKIENIPVIMPDEISNYKFKSVFIAARHAVKQVIENLTPNNLNLISFDGYFVIKNYERLSYIRDNFLEDEKSIKVFNAILFSMLTSSLQSCYEVMEKDMYFSLPEFSGNFEEIFVDAGAFVGDSVERFIWENLGTFKHIYAFEPGERQFHALQKRTLRLSEEWAFTEDKVTLIKAGLGEKSTKMSYTFVEDFPIRHGLISENSENSNKSEDKIQVCTLDEFLEGKEVTFIKVDIEGMEMDFLKGAQKTIKKYKPKIAICVYHYPSDLYEVAEYIKELVPEYKFKIRQHAPIFGDFVLYAY